MKKTLLAMFSLIALTGFAADPHAMIALNSNTPVQVNPTGVERVSTSKVKSGTRKNVVIQAGKDWKEFSFDFVIPPEGRVNMLLTGEMSKLEDNKYKVNWFTFAQLVIDGKSYTTDVSVVANRSFGGRYIPLTADPGKNITVTGRVRCSTDEEIAKADALAQFKTERAARKAAQKKAAGK